MVIGCLLPWLQVGALFQNRGIDSPDGAIVLVLGLIGMAVAAYDAFGKGSKVNWPYFLVGGIALAVALVDLADVQDRARKLASAAEELVGSSVDMWNFVGSGLYVIVLSSVILLVAGALAKAGGAAARRHPVADGEPDTGPQATLCIECGRYFDGEPRFCPHCGKPTKFNVKEGS